MNRQTKLYLQKTGILIAVYLTLRFLLPIVLPFFLAWTTVGFLVLLENKIHLPLFPLSVIFLLLFLAVCGSSLFCGCYLLYRPCMELIPICQEYWVQFSEYLTWIPQSLSGMFIDTMPSVLSCMFGLFVYSFSVILFAKDWNRFQTLLQKLPFAKQVTEAGKRISQSLKGWLHAQVRIMIVISTECAVGYYFFKIPGFIFWALLTGFIDALPVFGTGTIFVPWLLIVVLQGRYQFAFWLLLLWILAWFTRELLEPKLLGDGLGLLPVCFLMSVIAGLQLFGVIGLFAGPFGVLLIRELWAGLEMSDSPETSYSSSSGDE